jgi:hypothetical protein
MGEEREIERERRRKGLAYQLGAGGGAAHIGPNRKSERGKGGREGGRQGEIDR